MSLASRLAVLSHQQLVGLVISACEESPALKNRADALVAEAKPLPAWCVEEVLLSPDLLPSLMATLGPAERAAAGVCSAWAAAYARQIGKLRWVLPTVQRTIGGLRGARGCCMLPGGVLAVSCARDNRIKFEAAHDHTDPHKLADARFGVLASQAFEHPFGLAVTNDAVLVCDATAGTLTKFSLDGAMAELGTYHKPEDFGEGPFAVAVHQRTQRAFTVGLESIAIVDATTMQLVSSISGESLGTNADEEDTLMSVAVHEDLVIVSQASTSNNGFDGLRVLDLDGNHLRDITGSFHRPDALTVVHGRIYLVEELDDDYYEYHDEEVDQLDEFHGRRLFVIDIETGQTLQIANLVKASATSSPRPRINDIVVDGQEIFVSDPVSDRLDVLRFAGLVPDS